VGAQLQGSDGTGPSLFADRLRVDGRLLLNEGFCASGAVRLAGARVGGRLSLSNAQLRGTDADGRSLVADGIKCDRKLLLSGGFSTAGTVNFAAAEIQNLVVGDTPESLPILGDATGWILHDVNGVIRADRTTADAWLSGQPAQPCQALAAIYDRNGQPADARWIRYKSAVRSTRNSSRPAWLGRQAYRVTTGHGYYPLVAVLWLLLIFGVATTLATVAEDRFTTPVTSAIRADLENERPVVPGRVPAEWCSPEWDVHCLNPLTYGLATALPVVGSAPTWTPPDDSPALTTAFLIMRLLAWIFRNSAGRSDGPPSQTDVASAIRSVCVNRAAENEAAPHQPSVVEMGRRGNQAIGVSGRRS
jgi:hypothetical protein